jgi:ATP-dependent Clp protease protease subunit
MKRTSRLFCVALVAVLLASIPLPAQQPQQPGPDQIAVITFLGDINTVSMGQLMGVVTAQLNRGFHKIRIVISSGGGDPTAAFAAYNYLHNIPAEVSTFNFGNVDSAALILFCAGHERYSLPATRFLIHGTTINISGNVQMDVATVEGNLQMIKNLNDTVVRVVSSVTNKKEKEIETAVHGQMILTPTEAKDWGLIKDIRKEFMEPGAVLVSTNSGPPQPEFKPPFQFTSTTPVALTQQPQ